MGSSKRGCAKSTMVTVIPRRFDLMPTNETIFNLIHPDDGPLVARAKAVSAALLFSLISPILLGVVGLVLVVGVGIFSALLLSLPIVLPIWALIDPHSLRLTFEKGSHTTTSFRLEKADDQEED